MLPIRRWTGNGRSSLHGLTVANKRNINADAKLLPVFGKPQVTMFELAGIVGKHLS